MELSRIINSSIFDSKILKETIDQLSLIRLCKLSKKLKWKLLYRASRDGFSSDSFHEKCDNKAGTFTIIKTANGFIFGAFTEACWSEHFEKENNSFIFSYSNNYNFQVKIDCVKSEKAIFSHVDRALYLAKE